MMRPHVLLAAVVALAAPGLLAQDADHHEHQDHHAQAEDRPGHAGVDHSFADVERWTRVFDDPERAEWQKPEEVVAALGLEPGSVVADVGAGTGYFLAALAGAVAPGGKVFAIDTEIEMVRYLRKRADDENLAGVHAIRCEYDDAKIPEGIADRVLLVDTYHHIHDRPDYLRRLKGSLTPEGQVVVIDFLKKDLPVGPPVEHKMSRKAVIEEFEEAGYRLAAEEKFLPYQYFLRFAPGT